MCIYISRNITGKMHYLIPGKRVFLFIICSIDLSLAVLLFPKFVKSIHPSLQTNVSKSHLRLLYEVMFATNLHIKLYICIRWALKTISIGHFFFTVRFLSIYEITRNNEIVQSYDLYLQLMYMCRVNGKWLFFRYFTNCNKLTHIHIHLLHCSARIYFFNIQIHCMFKSKRC